MKKRLIITALILAVSSHAVYAKDIVEKPEDLESLQEYFYEVPSMVVPDVKVVDGSTQKPLHSMPLFKKTRIKITNYLRERDYKNAQKLIEKEKQQENEQEKIIKVKNKKTVEEAVVDENTLELEGGVKEQVTSTDVLLDADNIDYDDKTMDIIATGSPVLVFPPQEVTIKADKFIYNRVANTLKAFGKVEVIRAGNSVFGDFLEVNLNEENAFLDNVETKASFMTVTARKSELNEDTITLYDGKMISKDSYILNMHTKMIGGNHFNRMLIDDEERSSITDEIGDTAINIKAKEIIVNAKKDHDTITLKKAKIKYGDFTLFNMPSITAHTNKHHEYFEGNYPELGSRGRLGMFAGPGFAFDTPLQNGSTVKLIPMINNKSGIGVGGLLKYRSATNYTDFGYGSSADVFILKGKQYFDDKLYMQYGMNSFMDEWFLGPRMSKYNAELIYRDKGIIHSTIGEGLDLNFSHRAGLGYMHDSDYNRHGESISPSNMGTMRARYMANIDQALFNYEDKEKLRSLKLSLVMQGSAAVYGTGDTQFIGRIGPRIHTQYRYWMQDVGYFATAYQDGTPMPVYDSYRYGHGMVYLREALRVNKFLTLAWSGTINLTGDSPNGKMFQENSFIVALGPDDFKFNIGYDWVRQQTYFSLVLAMNTKGSGIEYEKMVIKNPDRLAKSNDEPVELKVFDAQQVKQPQKKMMYAEVIDIEDPDREQL